MDTGIVHANLIFKSIHLTWLAKVVPFVQFKIIVLTKNLKK